MEEKDKVIELKGRIYKCKSCGSFLRYDPISKKLKCKHCQSLEDIIPVPNAQELEYTKMSEKYYEPWGETKSVKCRSCGAVTILNKYETTSNCPFCGASNVTSVDDIPGLKPNAILPFAITEENAHEIYKQWLSNKKMAPKTLKKLADKQSVKGVYIPLFTFDTSTFSRYKIRYGQNYTVVVGSGKNRHTEIRTRWYVDSGVYNMDFNDIQVEVSQQITTKELNKIGGMDTDNAVRYHSQFISGYCSERYSTSLDDSWEVAKQYAYNKIRSAILNRYNYDVLDYCNISTSYNDNTFKYCLVPMWILSYKFKKKEYKCLINGRSGKVTGKAPISIIKTSAVSIVGLAVAAFVIYFIYKFFTGA